MTRIATLVPSSRPVAFVLAAAALLAAACAPFAAPAPSTEPQLRVMSFNVRYGTADEPDDRDEWPERRARVRAVVADHSPDIIGVQEVLRFQLDDLGRWFPGLAEVGVGRDDGREAGEYSAILYRRDRFELLEQGTFWLSDTPEVPGSKSWGNRIPRVVTWARLRDRDGLGTFYVYNTHWDHQSQPSRERSAELLRAHILAREHPDPVIVTGDFNAGELNPAYRMLLGDVAPDATGGRAELRLIDTFRAVHPGAEEVGTFNGFGRGAGLDKIDGVLVTSGWTVHDADIVRTRYGGRFPSDHFPVTARLGRAALEDGGSGGSAGPAASDFIRINQLGYLPGARKVGVRRRRRNVMQHGTNREGALRERRGDATLDRARARAASEPPQ